MRLAFLRFLINDSVTPYTYSDAALNAVCAIPQPASVLPAAVVAAALLAFRRFPVGA